MSFASGCTSIQDPNIKEESSVPPLAFAASGGYVEIMEMLIEHGADPRNGIVMELCRIQKCRVGHCPPLEL